MKRSPLPRLAVLASILFLCSCTGLSHAGVAADRSFVEAVGPEYLAYVEADAALTEEQKRYRRDTVARYREMVEAREGALGR